MSDSISGRESVFQFPWSRARRRDTYQQTEYAALIAELQDLRFLQKQMQQ
jgi:hypothetical protein